MTRLGQASGALVMAVVVWGAAACASTPPEAPWVDPRPNPDSADAVVFLLGDAGEAAVGRSPVTARLGHEVERWAEVLRRDSSIVVFFLGDNVYPDGVRDRSSSEFPGDSLTLLSQVLTVAGPRALRAGARAYFLAGNHDWGQTPGPDGLERLRNQADLLRAFHREGVHVGMIPEAGDPGPGVVDVGRRARFMVLDTQWWLQTADPLVQDSVMGDVARILGDTVGRHVALATHHPLVSGGTHAGFSRFAGGLGVRWLLHKTGALIQDLNSMPYRRFLTDIRRAFHEARPPFLWVGAHDHSLQVFRSLGDAEPPWSVVSGSGSEPTGVGPAEGMLWASSRPGFMRLTYMSGGAVHLHVYATDEGYAVCEGDEGERSACMREGIARFRVAYAVTLVEPDAPGDQEGRRR